MMLWNVITSELVSYWGRRFFLSDILFHGHVFAVQLSMSAPLRAPAIHWNRDETNEKTKSDEDEESGEKTHVAVRR